MVEGSEMVGLSASEALFGFAAWLASRKEEVTFSGHNDAGEPARLVGRFCEANGLEEPRARWENQLVWPTEEE